MSSFNINLTGIRRCPPVLTAQSQQVRNMAYSVRACSMALNTTMPNPAVYRSLNALYSQMLEEASKEKRISQALEQAITFYVKAEQTLVNTGKDMTSSSQRSDSSSSEERGTDKRGIIKQFLDWLFRKKVDPSLVATTEAQQNAADEAMKQRAEALRNEPKYSQAAWEKATTEERKQILQDYLHEMEAILGVSVAGNIVWDYKRPSNGTVNMGSYHNGDKTVHINEYILDSRSAKESYHLMTTITHEMRHAYQYAAVENPEKYKVTKETADAWKESFRNYSKEQAKGYDSYRNILVEKDARWFAGQS